MKIREDFQNLPIQINGQSCGVPEQDQIFYTTDEDETEEQHGARKAETRINPTNTEPTITIQTVSTNITKQQPERQARLRKTNKINIEQSKGAILHQLKAKLLHEKYSESIL